MVDIDLDISTGTVEKNIDELKERFEGETVYVVGSNVEYGVYLEMGTRDMPPYPWFRPAIREFKANPEQLIQRHTGFTSIDEIPSEDVLVKAVATTLSEQMTNNASALSGGVRSPGTDSEHPKRVTGNLAGSIQASKIK